jgi:hypothetical protein
MTTTNPTFESLIAHIRGFSGIDGRRPLLDRFTHRMFLEVVHAAEALREAQQPTRELAERADAALLLSVHVSERLTTMASIAPKGSRRLMLAVDALIAVAEEIQASLATLPYKLAPFRTVHALSAALVRHFDLAAIDADVIAGFILSGLQDNEA